MKNMLRPSFDMHADHFAGSLIAPVELVEYGDFQCKHCGEVYKSIKLLQECLGNDLRFVFRHFPVPTLHSLSLEAAVATEAAALEGKFWDMHDLIFQNQGFLAKNSFSRFAEEIKANPGTYENSLTYKKLVYKVINDFQIGQKGGVNSTPAFFINGRRYNGSHNFENLYRTCKYAMDLTAMAS